MNADPSLPVSEGKNAGIIQKLNSKSFPDDIRGENISPRLLSEHYSLRSSSFGKPVRKQEICASAFLTHLHLSEKLCLAQTLPDTCTAGSEKEEK